MYVPLYIVAIMASNINFVYNICEILKRCEFTCIIVPT